jgi:hypothetical protein
MAASWRFPIFRGFSDGRRPFSDRHTPHGWGIEYSALPMFIFGFCDYWIVRFRGR